MTNSAIFTLKNSFARSTALSVLCLSAIAAPNAAIAGEAFVTNSARYTHGHSQSNFDIASLSVVKGSRQFSSTAAKLYLDGSIGSAQKVTAPQKGFKGNTYQASKSSKGFGQETFGNQKSFGQGGLAFDDFTVHAAFSQEQGEEESFSATAVSGKTKSVDYFKEHSHTSSAGIR